MRMEPNKPHIARWYDKQRNEWLWALWTRKEFARLRVIPNVVTPKFETILSHALSLRNLR